MTKNYSHAVDNTAFEFPRWPSDTDITAFHASTQLPNGQLSIIVDPGAWTNVTGSDLTRKQVTRAMEHGYEPAQHQMSKMTVNGIGEGSQEASFKMVCPIAVPHADGQSHVHQLTAPIVEGTGKASIILPAHYYMYDAVVSTTL